jgi:Beta-lactamase
MTLLSTHASRRAESAQQISRAAVHRRQRRRQRPSRHLIRISPAAHGLVKTPRLGLGHTVGMKTTVMNPVKAFTLFALGLAIAAMGIYVADADDAPGAAVIGMLLMVVGVVLGVRAARNRLPRWAARTALAVGVVVAAFAAFLTHEVVVTAPLFPQSQEVPSVVDSAPSRQYAAAVERARELVRAAVLEQNLPGVSVAVGAGGTLVWAEGFGWRDVVTRAPVTPDTRFNIGTAASAVTAASAPLGLTNTGADAAKEWSPEAIGEEGEDFPPLTLLRHVIWQPLGLMPAEYPLPGDRATFYVPRSDDNNPRRGRRLMYMRDLACCANGMAFYSTPSDLVRFALATNPGSVNGELAGGMVMSLITRRDSGIVVAVTSNMAHANTSSLALRVGDAFAK